MKLGVDAGPNPSLGEINGWYTEEVSNNAQLCIECIAPVAQSQLI